MRAPTGAGKTDAALLWAQHQVEQARLNVGEDTEEVWSVREGFYDLNYGLNFNREGGSYDNFG